MGSTDSKSILTTGQLGWLSSKNQGTKSVVTGLNSLNLQQTHHLQKTYDSNHVKIWFSYLWMLRF